MTLDASTPIEQVAAMVSAALSAAGITAVLSGGALAIEILTPTQCVMERLAAFYHWRDRQALDQAVAVAGSQDVDIDAVRRWSNAEGQGERFAEFLRAIRRSSGH